MPKTLKDQEEYIAAATAQCDEDLEQRNTQEHNDGQST